MVGQILSKQTEILKRLKLLRTQVEDVEKSLQKSKEPAKLDLEHQDSPQKLPTGAAVLPGPIFSEAVGSSIAVSVPTILANFLCRKSLWVKN